MRHTSDLDSRHLNRRDFITGTTAGLAVSLLPASDAFAAGPQNSGTRRFLYVTNDDTKKVDVFDIAAGHSFVRSFPMAGGAVGGACAHAKSNRLFISHQNTEIVTAYDLTTDKVAWQVNTVEKFGLKHPDRISVTADGRALYVPMKQSRHPIVDAAGWPKHVTLILDASNGEKITEFIRPGEPHNSWAGERGQYMYVGGRSDPTMYVADQHTHQVVKKIGPFRWPIRPFVVDREERFIYANLTRSVGFGVGDIQAGKVLPEVQAETPRERTQHWSASGRLPHGDNPWSHGIGIRPGTGDVWLIDDEWGYLNIFETVTNPAQPKFKGRVQLFDEIDQPWLRESGNRWVAFSIDGRYCYPSDGSVVDTETGKKIAKRISPSEKLVEVEFLDGKGVRASGQQGGVYS